MKPEDKGLLLKDLCARLPYGVKGETLGSKTCTLTHLGKEGDFTADGYHGWLNSEQFIPYLRPMSSMTEEEKLMFYSNIQLDYYEHYFEVIASQIEWLNAHHFDYRGLIDRGLAIEVTDDNNPYKD